MNLQHTDTRNRLTVQTVGNALMLSINGPPLEFWAPRKYVISWLKSGRRGALDKPTDPPKKGPTAGKCMQTVYQLVYHFIVCCIALADDRVCVD